jgi:hypothetical protein
MDVASLLVRQRERVVVAVCWQLLFCRLFNESAYRHLDLQFNNLFACRNPTSPGEHSSEKKKAISETGSSIPHVDVHGKFSTRLIVGQACVKSDPG